MATNLAEAMAKAKRRRDLAVMPAKKGTRMITRRARCRNWRRCSPLA
jgi:hypothetical protein